MSLKKIHNLKWRKAKSGVVYCVSLTTQLSYIFITVNDNVFVQVRAKLLSKQQAMERSEKAKKQREMKKYGKKVPQKPSVLN